MAFLGIHGGSGPRSTLCASDTHLPKAAFAQNSVLPEGIFGHRLPVGEGLEVGETELGASVNPWWSSHSRLNLPRTHLSSHFHCKNRLK